MHRRATKQLFFNKLASVALLVVGTGVLTGCSESSARPPETAALAPALPVAVEPVTTATVHATYSTTATLEADVDARIQGKITGEVIEILVEEGDVVSQGQVLARLDGDRLALNARKARADFDNARRELARHAHLDERRAISKAAFEELEFRTDALHAALELAELEASYADIRASIGGVVSARHIKVGSQLALNGPAFDVADTTWLVAHLAIPQTELAKFSSGEAVNVSVDSAPGETVSATIARVSPTIDASTGTFRATVYLDNRDGALAPGMFGRFSVAYETHLNATLVPSSAVVVEDGTTVVYVVENGQAKRRTVQTGIQSADRTEVVSGLTADDLVIVSGQTQLRDGSRVLASATESIATG